jgi:hypothetical protein
LRHWPGRERNAFRLFERTRSRVPGFELSAFLLELVYIAVVGLKIAPLRNVQHLHGPRACSAACDFCQRLRHYEVLPSWRIGAARRL